MGQPIPAFGPEQLHLGNLLQILGEDPGQGPQTDPFEEVMAAIKQHHDEAVTAQGQVEPAQQAYTNAAAQPLSGQQPGDIVQNLFANIGSMATGNPMIAQQAQQQQASERQQRQMTREQHLQALHDEYVQKAQLASEMGHTDVAMDMQIKASKAEAAQQQIYKQKAQWADLKQKLAELGIEYKTRTDTAKIQGQYDLQATQERQKGTDLKLRAERIKAGQNPETGLHTLDFITKQRNYSANQYIKARTGNGQAFAIQNLQDAVSTPLHEDYKSANPINTMRDRLLSERVPSQKIGKKNEKYLFTGKNVYNNDGTINPDNRAEATAIVMGIVAMHKQEFDAVASQ